MSRPYAPSIRTVADHARVSMATVSNVLNGKPSVSADLAARVNIAGQELGYVVDSAASRLRSRRSKLAAVVVPDLTNPMFARFVSTLEHLARMDGFDLVVVSARNNPAEEASRLADIRSWRPAGLIVIPCDGAFKHDCPRASRSRPCLPTGYPTKQGSIWWRWTTVRRRARSPASRRVRVRELPGRWDHVVDKQCARALGRGGCPHQAHAHGNAGDRHRRPGRHGPSGTPN